MGIFATGSVFSELPPESQEDLLKITRKISLKKGEVVFQEGDPGVGFHFVLSGAVKIVKMNEEGKEHIIHILGPGELFGEVLLFNQGAYPATAIAQSDSLVGVVPNEKLEELVLRNNQLALLIIKALNRRLQVAQQKIRSLALTGAQAKVANTLLALLYERGQEETDQTWRLELDIPKQDLASLVGVTRETLARILSEWQKQKWIEWQGKTLLIHEVIKLKEISSSN